LERLKLSTPDISAPRIPISPSAGRRNGSNSQSALVSDIEDRETVEDEELLKKIAQVLEVTPEALKNVDFETAINIIGSIFD